MLYAAYWTPLRKVPGPWYSGLSGMRLSWSVFAKNRIHYVHDLHRRFGPIVRIGPNEVDVAEPYAAREIHRMGSKFTKAPFYALLSPGPVDNIFNFRDPKLHSARRRLYARGFTLESLRKEWEPMIYEIAQSAVRKIKEEATTGDAEIMGWFTLMANETVCRLTFGGGAGTVEHGVKHHFVLMLEQRMGDLAHLLQYFLPPLYYVGRVLARFNHRLHQVFYSQETMFAAGAQVVKEARGFGSSTKNLFAKALSEYEKDGGDKKSSSPSHMTDVDIITDAGALLLAGSDPTAISLTFLVWCVLCRPALQRELEEEVSAVEGNFTDEVCERMPVLNSVINESLRLYGPAPGCMPRSAPTGGATLGSWFIPEGTVVNTQNWSLHRDPNTWNDPDRFVFSLLPKCSTVETFCIKKKRLYKKPDPAWWLTCVKIRFDHTRWLTGANGLSEPTKLSFNPFGQGARQCLGIHLGRIQLRLATALFFRECRGARLGARVTPRSMEVIDSFIAGVPRERRCDVTLRA